MPRTVTRAPPSSEPTGGSTLWISKRLGAGDPWDVANFFPQIMGKDGKNHRKMRENHKNRWEKLKSIGKYEKNVGKS
jgi:hypothetical protein